MKKIKAVILAQTLFATCCTSVSVLADTVFLDGRKKLTELKIEDKVVLLPKKLQDLILNVEKEMKLKEENISLIKPYFTEHLDVRHHGYSKYKPGAILGIPQHFLFDSKADVKLTSVVNNIELPPESPDTEILKNSFFLSEAAKKFGIAREIFESQHYSFNTLSFLPMIVVLGVNAVFYITVKNIQSKLKRFFRVLYLNLIFMGFTFYFVTHDILSVHREGEADFQAAALGKSYLEGGIEYYEKMIARNKLLKKLDKKVPYTEDGDININWIRNTHMSLPRRVMYLKDLKKAAEKKEEKPSVWDYVFLRFGECTNEVCRNQNLQTDKNCVLKEVRKLKNERGIFYLQT